MENIIQSVHNPHIKELKKLKQKKYRDLKQKFLVEGIRLIEEALQTDWLEEVFYEEALLQTPRGQELFLRLETKIKEGLKLTPVTSVVLKELAQTESPQGIIAVACKKEWSLSLIQDKVKLIVIIDGIQDPGNLGTIIRTAWATGVGAVICLPNTVDPYNDKTVRSTMGGIFHVPIILADDWASVRDTCRHGGFQLIAGDLSAKKSYFSVTYADKIALVISNEGRGFQSVAREDVDLNILIPLKNQAESLNAAVACGVILYEIIRQRQKT